MLSESFWYALGKNTNTITLATLVGLHYSCIRCVAIFESPLLRKFRETFPCSSIPFSNVVYSAKTTTVVPRGMCVLGRDVIAGSVSNGNTHTTLYRTNMYGFLATRTRTNRTPYPHSHG